MTELFSIDTYALFITLIFIVTICFFVFYYSNKRKVIRALKVLPFTAISNLKLNVFSKISGRATPIDTPLKAPLSRRDCVFYSIKIEQKSSRKNTPWRVLVHQEKIQPFLIEQNGDFAMIQPTQNPKNYTSHLVVDYKISSGTFKNPSPEFELLLEFYNIKTSDYLGFNKWLRYKECILEVNEKVTIAGVVKWDSLQVPIKGYSYSKIATLKSTENNRIIISDLPETSSK